MRYELSDGEWAAIRPMLPNKARGVPRGGRRAVAVSRDVTRDDRRGRPAGASTGG